MRTMRESFSAFQKLCERHFDTVQPRSCIAPAKLHRVIQNATWTMWKTELVLVKSGLRPNQFPRVWFAVQGEKIVFLCMGTHGENYQDSILDRLAMTRVTDVF